MHKVSRVFHPVGQGAFYSESHILDDGNTFDVVYDCGTKNKLEWLHSRISNAGFNKKTVDLLFLSHFHEDHYKGIKLLTPKVIILPFLKEWDKVIFWIGRELKQSSFNPYLEEELRQRFPDAKIIQIEAVNEESDDRIPSDPLNVNNLINSAGNVILPSGIHLTLDVCDWIYVPINPCLDTHTIQEFKNLVNDPKYNLDINKLKSLDVNYYILKKKEIKEIYTKIGSPNEYSMAVYSGPLNNQHRLRGISFNRISNNICPRCNYDCPYESHFGRRRFRAGCLYLGDMNLNSSVEPLKIIYRFIGEELQKSIGTIQVPHHGSLLNFNMCILSLYISNLWEPIHWPINYVISVGESNTYGHPSWLVLNELMDSNNIILVTEKTTSAFIEKIRI